MLKKTLLHQLQVIAFGMKGWDFDGFRFSLNTHGLNHANELLIESMELSSQSKVWVNDMRCKCPASLLFWMEELQALHGLLMKSILSISDSSLLDNLVSLASISLPTEIDDSQKRDAAEKVIKEINNADLPWFEVVSQFLESWRSELIHLFSNTKHILTKKVVIHTIDKDIKYVNDSCIRLMNWIYNVSCPLHKSILSNTFTHFQRVPKTYEVLDATFPPSLMNMEIFLKRSLFFSADTFVLMNIQHLPSDHIEMIYDFLSSKEVMNKAINLHLIQVSTTILHKSTWVDNRSWNGKNLANIPQAMSNPNYDIAESLVVHSKHAGTGKSFFIANKMRSLDNFEKQTICVHERSTVASLIDQLNINQVDPSNFNNNPNIAVHVSFLFSGATTSIENNKLFSTLNYFFFSFFILRGVYDHLSGSFFQARGKKWHMYIELSDIGSCKEWLLLHIPVLSRCQYIEPSQTFVVNDNVERVCMYLRAYRDGTIDRKFSNTPVNKKIMFLLDKSGSMNSELNDGRSNTTTTALAVAADNMLKIYNSHVNVKDVSL